MVHISQLADHRVKSVSDVTKEGEEMLVKALQFDEKGRLVLSRKAVLEEQKK